MREIELKPSRLLGVLLAGMTALALAATGLAAVSAGVQVALAAAVIGLCVWGWRRALPMGNLRMAGDGRLQSLDGRGEWGDVEVLSDSFVSTALIVLRYQTAGGTVRTLALLPDNAAADDLRRLRVSLRWIRRTRSDTSVQDAG